MTPPLTQLAYALVSRARGEADGITSDYEGYRAESEIGSNNAYRIDLATGEVRLVADCFGAPNGLVFSPDERLLFVTAETSLYSVVMGVTGTHPTGPGRRPWL